MTMVTLRHRNRYTRQFRISSSSRESGIRQTVMNSQVLALRIIGFAVFASSLARTCPNRLARCWPRSSGSEIFPAEADQCAERFPVGAGVDVPAHPPSRRHWQQDDRIRAPGGERPHVRIVALLSRCCARPRNRSAVLAIYRAPLSLPGPRVVVDAKCGLLARGQAAGSAHSIRHRRGRTLCAGRKDRRAG